MTALLIIGIVILSLILLTAFLLSLRGTISIIYNGELLITLKILFVKIKLYPREEKKRKVRSMSAFRAKRIRRAARRKAEKERQRELERRREKALKKKAKEEAKKKKSVSEKISDAVDTIRLVSDVAMVAVKRFTKHLRIKVARIKIKVASPDAAKTAIAYGAIVETVNTLLPVLMEVKNFNLPSKEDLDVVADFTTETPEFDINLSLSIRVWHLLDVAIAAIIKAMPHMAKRNKKKDEAEKDHKFTD